MNKKRVLILSVAQGGGHISAAEALVAQHALTGGDYEIRHEECLSFTDERFQAIYRDGYFKMVNTQPNLLGLWYDHDDKPWGKKRFRLFEKFNSVLLLRMIYEYHPDLIVCTHPWPAELVSRIKGKGHTTASLMIVTTDFDVHALWLCKHADLYCVATEQSKKYLARVGVDPAKVLVTGIPVKPAFARANRKPSMRSKHGINEERPAILLSAGGYGLGPVPEVLKCLLRVEHPVQIVVVCGRNDDLKRKIDEIAATAGDRHLIKVIGFTQEMNEIMSACDLIVGKTGGLTTSEAITQGLVFVVVNPIPGQEVRNANYLANAGAAIHCNDLEVLDVLIDDLLKSPARLYDMQTNAHLIAKPKAAFEILKLVSGLVKPNSGLTIWKPQKRFCRAVGNLLNWFASR